jgi:hypothetical protein
MQDLVSAQRHRIVATPTFITNHPALWKISSRLLFFLVRLAFMSDDKIRESVKLDCEMCVSGALTPVAIRLSETTGTTRQRLADATPRLRQDHANNLPYGVSRAGHSYWHQILPPASSADRS